MQVLPLALLLATVALGASDPLEGLTCTAESVEQANSAQLYTILTELADSTFFRLVRVTEAGDCPLNLPGGAPAPSSCAAPSPTGIEEAFRGGGLFALKPTPSPASLCSVEAEKSPHAVAEIVDMQISAAEASAHSEFKTDMDCVVEGTFSIRPDYWLDICSDQATPTGPTAEYVNLKLNPERNTG